jgi:type VI secretion system secreted protein VgrG
MASPKSGKAGSAVTPAEPNASQEADNAAPGEADKAKAAQLTLKPRASGSAPRKPYKRDPKKKSWIEIQLLDEEGTPVASEKYRVTLPDGETMAEGTLDEKGLARIDGIDPGTCKITFPELDKAAWKRK